MLLNVLLIFMKELSRCFCVVFFSRYCFHCLFHYTFFSIENEQIYLSIRIDSMGGRTEYLKLACLLETSQIVVHIKSTIRSWDVLNLVM